MSNTRDAEWSDFARGDVVLVPGEKLTHKIALEETEMFYPRTVCERRVHDKFRLNSLDMYVAVAVGGTPTCFLCAPGGPNERRR